MLTPFDLEAAARKAYPAVDASIKGRHFSVYFMQELVLRIYCGMTSYFVITGCMEEPVVAQDDQEVLGILARVMDPSIGVDAEGIIDDLCERSKRFGAASERRAGEAVIHLPKRDVLWKVEGGALLKNGHRFPSRFRPAWALQDAVVDMFGRAA